MLVEVLDGVCNYNLIQFVWSICKGGKSNLKKHQLENLMCASAVLGDAFSFFAPFGIVNHKLKHSAAICIKSHIYMLPLMGIHEHLRHVPLQFRYLRDRPFFICFLAEIERQNNTKEKTYRFESNCVDLSLVCWEPRVSIFMVAELSILLTATRWYDIYWYSVLRSILRDLLRYAGPLTRCHTWVLHRRVIGVRITVHLNSVFILQLALSSSLVVGCTSNSSFGLIRYCMLEFILTSPAHGSSSSLHQCRETGLLITRSAALAEAVRLQRHLGHNHGLRGAPRSSCVLLVPISCCCLETDASDCCHRRPSRIHERFMFEFQQLQSLASLWRHYHTIFCGLSAHHVSPRKNSMHTREIRLEELGALMSPSCYSSCGCSAVLVVVKALGIVAVED
jgi:hypothetical protein